MSEDLLDSKSKVDIFEDFELTEEVSKKRQIIRRVIPTIIANEIIGVLPMTGPVGQIHTLRVKYKDEPNN